ncbi:MAG TPA: hypothetical protein VD862_03540 [Candidatus Paceibacterota bacterium]|nr:hypothetical protein [Candidatus Paceibacterota bacterium]
MPEKPPQPGASLDALKGGAVDFKGRAIQPKEPKKDGEATLTSAPVDLKELIGKALGKK